MIFKFTTIAILLLLSLMATIALTGLQVAADLSYRKDNFIDSLKPTPKGRHNARAFC